MTRDNSFDWERKKVTELDLTGRKIAVIGGSGGLGREFARTLAQRGAQVLVVGRTSRDNDVQGIKFEQADLALMSNALKVGKSLPAEDLNQIIFSTGIFASPERQETSEGIEKDFAVSFLNRLVILNEIIPRLGKNSNQNFGVEPKPRVFVMGYPGAGQTGNINDLNSEKSYGAVAAHMNNVAGNESIVLDFKNRYPNINFYGLNPGLVKTNIRNNYLGQGSWKSKVAECIIGLTNQTPQQYANKLVPLLVSPDIENKSGSMFDKNGNPIRSTPALTDSYVREFIATSEALLKKHVQNNSTNTK